MTTLEVSIEPDCFEGEVRSVTAEGLAFAR